MWLLKVQGGLELSEQDLGCWDEVPTSVVIDALALILHREKGPPFVVEYRGFDRYVCARIANAAQGAAPEALGYSVSVEKNSVIFEHDIFIGGMRLRPTAPAAIPDRCWRRGI